jgi:hypothetical protein
MKRLLMLLCLAAGLLLGQSTSYTSGIVPQVVAGGGWKTTFILSNVSKTYSGTVNLSFRDDFGRPLALTLNGGIFQPPRTSLNVTLKPKTIQVWETSEFAPASTIQGYGMLSYQNAVVNVRTIFAQRLPDGHWSEAEAPVVSTAMTNYGMTYDHTQGFSTGMALINPDTSRPLDYRMVFYDEAGKEQANVLLTLQPGAHETFSVAERFAVTRGRRGQINVFRVTSTVSSTSHSALGLRFHPLGSFTNIDLVTAY